jgi:hypothetical protein
MDMIRARAMKWMGLLTTGGTLLQITACLGPDPQLYVTNIAISTLISNVVSTIYQLLVSGLTGTA